MQHCPQDHSYDDGNTYVDPRGYRHCKTCRRDRMVDRRKGTQVGYANARKTHCPQKHEYTEENTYRNPQGRRWCRTCMASNSALQNIKRYGLSEERLKEMLEEQKGLCAICQVAMTTPNIDHDHACCPKNESCGDCVRGLLCSRCNKGLGNFLDNPQLLLAAVSYLNTP